MIARPKGLGFGFLIFGLSLASMAEAAPCLLRKVPQAKQASLKVYFTKFVKEDKTGGQYRRCRLVTKATPNAKTFYITPFRQDATVIVHKSNWPR